MVQGDAAASCLHDVDKALTSVLLCLPPHTPVPPHYPWSDAQTSQPPQQVGTVLRIHIAQLHSNGLQGKEARQQHACGV
jgi:hypothetical protein